MPPLAYALTFHVLGHLLFGDLLIWITAWCLSPPSSAVTCHLPRVALLVFLLPYLSPSTGSFMQKTSVTLLSALLWGVLGHSPVLIAQTERRQHCEAEGLLVPNWAGSHLWILLSKAE